MTFEECTKAQREKLYVVFGYDDSEELVKIIYVASNGACGCRDILEDYAQWECSQARLLRIATAKDILELGPGAYD
jgi:hypothetical protein